MIVVPQSQPVQVQRVRLIYEGGALKPRNWEMATKVIKATQENSKGVEVLFQ